MSESRAGLPSAPHRPGTVLAAAIVTWSAAGIVLLATASLVVFALWLGGPILDSLPGSRPLVLLVATAAAAWSLLACALAWWALGGLAWARVALVASSVATILVSVPGVLLVVPVVSLVSAPIVVALLFTGGANDWFRADGARDLSSVDGSFHRRTV